MARFECKFISRVLMRSVGLTVIVPSPTIPECGGIAPKEATYRIEEKYPVLYLLHGMGNSHTDWCGYSNIEFYAEERNMAVVCISGENSFYRKDEDGNDFFAFLAEEVPEFVTNMFPISREKAHTYIAGLSMGGYGSLFHGLSHPERFAAIGAFSTALDMKTSKQKEDKRSRSVDLYDLLEHRKKEQSDFPEVYMSCGTEDDFFRSNLLFQERLRQAGFNVTWRAVSGFAHEWRFWDRQVESFLQWIPRTDGYAKGTPRMV